MPCKGMPMVSIISKGNPYERIDTLPRIPLLNFLRRPSSSMPEVITEAYENLDHKLCWPIVQPDLMMEDVAGLLSLASRIRQRSRNISTPR